MKKLRKFVTLALSTALLTLALGACGDGDNGEVSGGVSTPDSQSSQASEDAISSRESQTEPVTVKLGVVGSIYEELWTPAQEALRAEGINLEIVQFSDYVTPNNALANGEIDLNAFQHRIYLQSEIESYGYAIQNIGNTFIIPLNLYSQKISSVEELKDGDTVAIPDDLTNGGRALKVLEAAGLITLNPEAAFNPTLDDIENYNVGITIKELKANVIPSTLPDVDAAVVNGNYALDFGLKTEEAIYQDSVLDVEEYWNLIAARTADLEDTEKVAIYDKVVKAFQSPETETVFNDNYGGYFIKVGWDQDLLAK
ncbi:MAG: MetQ/NlpA family ABC transporter substrate-binding protein [bacterium]|nr:MetQ/NlpA family ABC transporter substrate-binding protein [bacterium]MCM1374807.1 MetQ/NlpA family ABC transporter substrate-binding protein [Muribaculum sp.]